MKSKMSCCNAALVKRNLIKGLPLWGAYLLIWLVLLPVMLYTRDGWNYAADAQDHILSMAAYASQPFGAGYGLAAACLVFMHLYKSRSANFFGALPLTRSDLFVTQFVSGLLMAVLPNLIVVLLSLPSVFLWGAVLVKDFFTWFAVMTLTFLFYYSFASMLAMVTSNLIALVMLYGVLNFTAVVLESIVRELLQYFVFGMEFNGDFMFDWASPLFYAVLQGDGPDVRSVWDEVTSRNVAYVFEGWPIVLIMAAVGVVFAVVAYFLHKYRRMESAGDVIAVRHLKPVFLYCFTVGCSLVLGYLLANLVVARSIGTEDFIPVLVCLAVGGWIGFFAGQMMLQKTVRVFQKANWGKWAVTTLLITAAMLCARFDLFGYAAYVPEADEVQSVSLAYRNDYSEDPVFIDKVIRLHQTCLDRQKETENADPYEGYFSFDIHYQMEDGSTVSRRYYAPAGEEAYIDPDSLMNLFYDAINDPDYKLLRCLPQGYQAKDILYCEIYNHHKGQSVHLTQQEAYDFLKTCLVPDLRETIMENVSYYSPKEYEYQETAISVQLEFDRKLFPDGSGNRYYHFSVTQDAQRILDFAAAHGITAGVIE